MAGGVDVSFRVLLKQGALTRCDDALYYLVAANGIFQVRNTPAFLAVTPAAPPLPGLAPQHPVLRLRIPRIRARLLGEALAFFRAVFEADGAEAIVALFYSFEQRRYRLDAPLQSVPGYRRWDGSWRALPQLHYGPAPRPPGYVRFGTIHSHADLPAVASERDHADERCQDGLHVVYGDLQRAEASRSASFVAGGMRFELDPDDVLEPDAPHAPEANPVWLARVRRIETDVGFDRFETVEAGGCPSPDVTS